MIINEKLSIKNWSEDDRPREKLLQKGTESLSNAELIAILIGSGSKNESAVDLSKRILASVNNNFNELAKFDINTLKKFKGIGEAKAITIIAALEIGRRRRAEIIKEKQSIKSSKDVFEIFGSMLGDLPHEEFHVLYLNNANKIITMSNIGKGGIKSTATDIKIILKKCIELLASSIIVCHNHPSGNIKASKSDIDLTKKLKDACKTMDISLLDHLIVSNSEYFSFADEGLM